MLSKVERILAFTKNEVKCNEEKIDRGFDVVLR